MPELPEKQFELAMAAVDAFGSPEWPCTSQRFRQSITPGGSTNPTAVSPPPSSSMKPPCVVPCCARQSHSERHAAFDRLVENFGTIGWGNRAAELERRLETSI